MSDAGNSIRVRKKLLKLVPDNRRKYVKHCIKKLHSCTSESKFDRALKRIPSEWK